MQDNSRWSASQVCWAIVATFIIGVVLGMEAAVVIQGVG